MEQFWDKINENYQKIVSSFIIWYLCYTSNLKILPQNSTNLLTLSYVISSICEVLSINSTSYPILR